MDADSLRREARRYRQLARGINDDKTVALLEEMAHELERRAELAGRNSSGPIPARLGLRGA